MIVKWEAKDIKGGRIVVKPGVDEKQMIGYICEPEANNYVVISMCDGLVNKHGTKESLALMLSQEGYLPQEIA